MSVAVAASQARNFSVDEVRRDFPILNQEVHGRPLVYLDNAATTQKPRAMLDALSHYYCHDNANVHRAAHALSDRATEKFEQARATVARFLSASNSRQIIWTRGCTEGLNLIAATWGRQNIEAGDRILVPRLEHHSNIVPWQMLAAAKNAEVVPIEVTEKGEIDLECFREAVTKGAKLVVVNHVSNAMGTINPVESIVSAAKKAGACVVIDGAQAVAHFPVNVEALGADFYVFSGHKLYGPTGIGALWGRESLLESMPPFLFGGEMIEQVSFEGTTFASLPYKFEAGTPNIAGAIGLAASIDYLCSFDRESVAQHEHDVLRYAQHALEKIDGLRLFGSQEHNAGVASFVIDGVHPADLGTLLDQEGIAVRTGHHCAQPLMSHYGVPGSVRASFAMYNTCDEVDAFIAALNKVLALLR